MISDYGSEEAFYAYVQTEYGYKVNSIESAVSANHEYRVLVISKYALDCKQYNSTYESTTWETCTLRGWLNGTFLNGAFSEAELTMIPSVFVSADNNQNYSSSPGNPTTDKVFLLSITEAYKYGDFFQFLLLTGIRKGEGFGLIWKNVDLEKNEVNIGQQLFYDKESQSYLVQSVKNSRPRIVALNDQARKILVNRQAQRTSDNPDDFVFTTSRGTHLCSTTIHNSYKRALKKVGLDKLRIHDLRHNCATINLSAGVDIKSVQMTLGHATESFTLKQYVHANTEMLHNAAQKTSAFFDQITTTAATTVATQVKTE